MSVLIKNMDMPNGCRHCGLLINCDDCEGYECFCSASGSNVGYFESLSDTQRHEDCPLVPVPTPHGDLIDKRSLFKQAPGKMTHFHDGIFDWEIRNAPKWLKENVPTVIESEE